MMTNEKREELNGSVELLMRHQLWRRGKAERMTDSPSELGNAIDCVCGGVLDYLEMQKDFDKLLQERNRMVMERDDMRTMAMRGVEVVKERDALRAERNRFKAILAAFRIPHKRKKKR